MSEPTITLELSGAELRLAEAALRSFLSDFGHDEADVVVRIRALLAKLPQIPEATPAR